MSIEPEAFDGVSDILITHEHDDHLDLARIVEVSNSRPVRLFAPEPVREPAERAGLAETVTVVAAGDEFDAPRTGRSALGQAP